MADTPTKKYSEMDYWEKRRYRREKKYERERIERIMQAEREKTMLLLRGGDIYSTEELAILPETLKWLIKCEYIVAVGGINKKGERVYFEIEKAVEPAPVPASGEMIFETLVAIGKELLGYRDAVAGFTPQVYLNRFGFTNINSGYETTWHTAARLIRKTAHDIYGNTEDDAYVNLQTIICTPEIAVDDWLVEMARSGYGKDETPAPAPTPVKRPKFTPALSLWQITKIGLGSLPAVEIKPVGNDGKYRVYAWSESRKMLIAMSDSLEWSAANQIRSTLSNEIWSGQRVIA